MQAAITGGTGFIGSHLVDSLLERGWQVRILRHKRLPHRKDVESIAGQVDRPEALYRLFSGADVVFHLASAMGAAQIGSRDFFRINVGGTEAVLQVARKIRVKRVVHVSSAGVLGAVPEGVIASEDFPPRPITVYDKTKWLAEKAALLAARKGQEVIVVRPGWVYGPRDRRTLKLIKAVRKKLFFLVNGGKSRQTPIWVQDLVEGMVAAAEKGRSGVVYHLAGAEILTVEQMAAAMAGCLQVKLRRWSPPLALLKLGASVGDGFGRLFQHEFPLTSARLSFFLHSKPLSINRAKEQLGFNPVTFFNEGIERAIRWYKESGWL